MTAGQLPTMEGRCPMTHADLVQRAARWLRNTQRCPVVLAECHSFAREIPDAIGFNANGYSVVVECKVSRGDFLGDKHKVTRRVDRSGGGRSMGHQRWYLVLPGVYKPSDDLHGWGVLELRGSRCYKVAQPARNGDRPDPELALLVAAFRRRDRLFYTEKWPAPREEDVA